ncbi:MAG: biotin/lipoyl-binding protein [Bryobacteraceae bacterium]
MKRFAAALATIGALAAGLGWLLLREDPPPEVNFARVRRGRLVSRLVTNGRIEPVGDIAISAPRDGILTRILIQPGSQVRAGEPVAELEAGGFQADLASARARLTEAQAQLLVAESGGARASVAEIAAATSRVDQDLAAARQKAESVARLVEKDAAPRAELDEARATIARLETERTNLAAKRAALVPEGSRETARARVAEAQSAIARIEAQVAQSTIRAPASGSVTIWRSGILARRAPET